MSKEAFAVASLVEKNLRLMSFVKDEKFAAKPMVMQPGYGSIPTSYRFDFEKGDRVLSVLYMPGSDGGGVLSVFVEKNYSNEMLDFIVPVLG